MQPSKIIANFHIEYFSPNLVTVYFRNTDHKTRSIKINRSFSIRSSDSGIVWSNEYQCSYSETLSSPLSAFSDETTGMFCVVTHSSSNVYSSTPPAQILYSTKDFPIFSKLRLSPEFSGMIMLQTVILIQTCLK